MKISSDGYVIRQGNIITVSPQDEVARLRRKIKEKEPKEGVRIKRGNEGVPYIQVSKSCKFLPGRTALASNLGSRPAFRCLQYRNSAFPYSVSPKCPSARGMQGHSNKIKQEFGLTFQRPLLE